MHPVFEWIAAAGDCSPQEAARAFEGWKPVYHHIGGEPVCCALMRGTEIHFVVAPSRRGRLITRSATREFLRPLFRPLGFLTTRILRSRPDCARFVERLGFKKTWCDETTDYFMLTTLPFESRRHA